MTEKNPLEQPKDPNKVPDELSWKKTLDDEAERQDLAEKFKKWDKELDDEWASLTDEEKIQKEEELKRQIEEDEKEWQKIQGDPDIDEDVNEALKILEEHRRKLEEINRLRN